MNGDKTFFETIQDIVVANDVSVFTIKIRMAVEQEKKRLTRIEITSLLNGAVKSLQRASQIKEDNSNEAYNEAVRARSNLEVVLPLMKLLTKS